MLEKTKINAKEAGEGPYFFKKTFHSDWCIVVRLKIENYLPIVDKSLTVDNCPPFNGYLALTSLRCSFEYSLIDPLSFAGLDLIGVC